ncbi:MAG: carbonic anhydrase family protein [Enterobacterales bacterium]|nr:carbonic anhydrase family protein [Enterobacterales bacterium]
MHHRILLISTISTFSKSVLVLVCALLSPSILASASSHWGYSGDKGPLHWAELSSDNAACSGKNQSPINLTGFIEAELPAIDFSYAKQGKDSNEILNNGHTIQINTQQDSHIKVDDQKFTLLQVHFHSPSENHLNGKSYPFEAHLVHANEQGELAVIGVFFELGEANSALTKAWAAMPKHEDQKFHFANLINSSELLSENKDYYRFSGSLTTPPCSEGVRWLVMKQSLTLSDWQLKAFNQVLGEANNRPIQPINARRILQ